MALYGDSILFEAEFIGGLHSAAFRARGVRHITTEAVPGKRLDSGDHRLALADGPTWLFVHAGVNDVIFLSPSMTEAEVMRSVAAALDRLVRDARSAGVRCIVLHRVDGRDYRVHDTVADTARAKVVERRALAVTNHYRDIADAYPDVVLAEWVPDETTDGVHPTLAALRNWSAETPAVIDAVRSGGC